MNSPSKSPLLVLVLLAMNCGGRSDSTEQIWGQSDLGGMTSMGGALADGGYPVAGGSPSSGGYIGIGGELSFGGYIGTGGSPYSVGGWVNFGGTLSSGGTVSKGGATAKGGTTAKGGAGGTSSTSIAGSCCAARTSSGCVTPSIQACVCAVDSFCCLGSWDNYCVTEVDSLKCGVCSTGVGGATSVGGNTSKGGTSSLGGNTSKGGTSSTTSSTTTNRGGATAFTSTSGGTTALSVGGTTAVVSGGTQAGGSSTIASTLAAGGAVSTLGGGSSTTPGPTTLIDDFEDGNGELPQIAGRVGYFYTMNDATLTGKQLPVYGSVIFDAKAITDRAQSAYAIWTAGSGFTDWGAGLGVYLNTNQAQGRFYNASAYRGVTFWARVDEGTANVIRFNISDVASVSDGGICTSCWDHFGTPVTLSTTWRRYAFLFSSLTTRGWAVPTPAKLDSSKIRGFEFSVQAGVSFSFYIDDLAFVP